MAKKIQCPNCGYETNSKKIMAIHTSKCNPMHFKRLEDYTITELRQRARDNRIEGAYKMRKQELVERLGKL